MQVTSSSIRSTSPTQVARRAPMPCTMKTGGPLPVTVNAHSTDLTTDLAMNRFPSGDFGVVASCRSGLARKTTRCRPIVSHDLVEHDLNPLQRHHKCLTN